MRGILEEVQVRRATSAASALPASRGSGFGASAAALSRPLPPSFPAGNSRGRLCLSAAAPCNRQNIHALCEYVNNPWR